MLNLKPPIFLCTHNLIITSLNMSHCVRDLRVVKLCLLLAVGLSEMALLKFLVKKNNGSDTLQLPSVSLCASTTLSEKDIRSVNESVLKKLEVKKPTLITRKVSTREKHNGYTPQITKYAAENGLGYYVL